MGDFFKPAQVENEGVRAILVPAFRVKLLRNTIFPNSESRPLEFITARDVELAPKQCLALTVKVN